MSNRLVIAALAAAVSLSGCATTPQAVNLYAISASPTMSQDQAMAVCVPRARLTSSQMQISGTQQPNGYCPPGSPCAIQASSNAFANSLAASQGYTDALRMCLAEAGWAF
jgi:hypothetical protein